MNLTSQLLIHVTTIAGFQKCIFLSSGNVDFPAAVECSDCSQILEIVRSS